MKMLYTANGRYIHCLPRKGTAPGHHRLREKKEYEVDVQSLCSLHPQLAHPAGKEISSFCEEDGEQFQCHSSTAAGGTVCSALLVRGPGCSWHRGYRA